MNEINIKLRLYQEPLYNDIMAQLEIHDKVLGQADTGYGKSVIIGHLANTLPGRTLVLTHRIELLNQNQVFIKDCGVLTAKVRHNTPLKRNKTVISMAQTCAARFKKYGSKYIGNFDNVITDEIHVDFFRAVYDQLGSIKLIGLTATPIKTEKESKMVDGVEFVRTVGFKSDFDVLVQGIKTQELIELGYLTKDYNIQLTPPDLSKLIKSENTPDGYTSKSLTEVFGSSATIKTVIEGYEKYAKGKKTLIFNPTTKVNKAMYEEFVALGYNVKMYDSVNKVKGQTRKGITDWFQNTPDAILLNVGVFTTGFSVNDLEAILYNKATRSLSLYLQSVGRGSRVVKPPQIKERFLVLDMGLNVARLGKWSDSRDWNKYFNHGEWKKKRESDILDFWECWSCGYFNNQGEVFNQLLERLECRNCGEPKKIKETEKRFIKGKFVVLEEPDHPTAKQIIEYVLRAGGDGNMAHRMVKKQIYELFLYHTDESDYRARTSKYHRRIGEIYRPIYFAVMKHPALPGKNRRLDTEMQNIIKKVETIYN
jgi:superfamily II DNA or RNA helicase